MVQVKKVFQNGQDVAVFKRNLFETVKARTPFGRLLIRRAHDGEAHEVKFDGQATADHAKIVQACLQWIKVSIPAEEAEGRPLPPKTNPALDEIRTQLEALRAENEALRAEVERLKSSKAAAATISTIKGELEALRKVIEGQAEITPITIPPTVACVGESAPAAEEEHDEPETGTDEIRDLVVAAEHEASLNGFFSRFGEAMPC